MCLPSAKTQTCEGKSQSCEFPQVRFGTQWPPHGPEHSWLTQSLPSLTVFSASGPASCHGYWVWSWPGAQSIGWFYVCKGATPFLRSLLSWLFVFKFILWTGSHGDTGKALSRQKPFVSDSCFLSSCIAYERFAPFYNISDSFVLPPRLFCHFCLGHSAKTCPLIDGLAFSPASANQVLS